MSRLMHPVAALSGMITRVTLPVTGKKRKRIFLP